MSKQFNYKLFGLETRDIFVYEAMLAAPKASSIRSIAELTKQNRGTTFEIIKKLSELGLVGSHFKNKRKYYFAKPPSSLKSYAKEVQRNVSEQVELVESYVSELTLTKARELSDQFTQFYDGEDEIAALLRDVLDTVRKTESKSYRVISSAEVRHHLYTKFKNFTKERIRLGINVNVIGVGTAGKKAKLANVKLLSSTQTPASYVIIYNDKVACISLSDFLEVRGVLIHNKGVADLHALVFDQLWRSL